MSIARVNEMTENKGDFTAWKDKLSKLAASTSTKLQVDVNCEPNGINKLET